MIKPDFIPKIKMSSRYRSIRKGQIPLPNDGESCSQHPHQTAAFFCMDPECNHQCVCLDCVTTIHRGHELEKFTTFIANRQAYIRKQIHIGKEHHLKPILRQIEISEKMLSRNTRDSNEIVKQILDRENELQSQMEGLREGFVRSCRTVEMRNKRKLDQYIEKLLQHRANVQENVHQFEDALKALAHMDVNQLHLLSEFPLEAFRLSFPKLGSFKDFQPRNVLETASCLEHVYGMHTKNQILTDNELQLVQMVSPHNKIKFIYPVLDLLCLWSWNDKQISMVNRRGRIVHTIGINIKSTNEVDGVSESQGDLEDSLHGDDLSIDILNMTFSPSDESFWFCCSDGVIRQLVSYVECKDRIFSARKPLAICICDTGEIIVGFVDHISHYHTDCQVKNTQDLSKLEEKAKKGLGYPRQITTNSKTKQIVVLGSISVFVLDQDLNLIWDYRTVLQNQNLCDAGSIFGPETVCQDADGKVIIADNCKNTMFVIDRDMEVKQIDSMKDEYPTAICPTRNNTAWIAFTDISGKPACKQIKLPF